MKMKMEFPVRVESMRSRVKSLPLPQILFQQDHMGEVCVDKGVGEDPGFAGQIVIINS